MYKKVEKNIFLQYKEINTKYKIQTIMETALANVLRNFIVLADNDGTIRDTNNVKDKCLNDFCTREIGPMLQSCVLPTEIHRQLHGKPMSEIFVEIAKKCYEKTISLEEGQELTKRLNLYIRPEYISRPVYNGAIEFYSALKNMGLPMYILTGMEPDLVEEGLNANGMKGIFDGILGAPKNKRENIAEILASHKGCRILAMGDSYEEYAETTAYPGTIFLAFDFEQRKKRVFPENVNVLTQYGESVWQEIEVQLKQRL